jgi:hypothetical protein
MVGLATFVAVGTGGAGEGKGEVPALQSTAMAPLPPPCAGWARCHTPIPAATPTRARTMNTMRQRMTYPPWFVTPPDRWQDYTPLIVK